MACLDSPSTQCRERAEALKDTWVSLGKAQVRAERGSRGRGSGSEVCPGQPEEEEAGWLPERSLQSLLWVLPQCDDEKP